MIISFCILAITNNISFFCLIQCPVTIWHPLSLKSSRGIRKVSASSYCVTGDGTFNQEVVKSNNSVWTEAVPSQ